MSERFNYLRSPSALFRLRQFGEAVYNLIGERAYLVGSVLDRPDFRDVDVRIMLDDEIFERTFGGDGLWVTNGSLTLANMALSAMAREMTGLDVDVQIQRTSDANTVYGKHKRHPLMLPHTTPYVPVTDVGE
jgi:hypothetical protein